MPLAILVTASLLLVSLHATRGQTQEPATTVAVPEAEIRIADRVLFPVRGTTSFPAAVRAASIEARILEVVPDARVVRWVTMLLLS